MKRHDRYGQLALKTIGSSPSTWRCGFCYRRRSPRRRDRGVGNTADSVAAPIMGEFLATVLSNANPELSDSKITSVADHHQIVLEWTAFALAKVPIRERLHRRLYRLRRTDSSRPGIHGHAVRRFRVGYGC